MASQLRLLSGGAGLVPVDGCRWFNGAECAPTQRGPSFLGAQTRAVTSLPFLQGALPDFRLPARSPAPPHILSLLSPRGPGPEGAGGPKPRAQPERHRSGSRSSSGLGRERLGHVSGSPGLSVVTPSFLARECLLYTRPKLRRSQFGVILPQDDIGQYMGTFLVVTTGEAVLLARGG